MQKISRHRLAEFIAEKYAAGTLDPRTLQGVAAYLVENKLAQNADLLLDDIAAILASRHGLLRAEVISARPLDASSRQAVLDFITQAESATRVELEETIDEQLIGGVIVRTPTAELDASIRTKLKTLATMKGNEE